MTRVVGAALREHARTRPDALFLWCGNSKLTFGEADRVADRVATGLADAGIARGDRVAILSLNRPEMLELMFGCARLGCVQVPLNAALKGEFLRSQLSDCQAGALIADRAGAMAAGGLLASLPSVRRVIALDDPLPDLPDVTVTAYESVRCAERRELDWRPSVSDPVSILYTSGTTGLPKGCVLSHGYYTHVGRTMADAWDLRPGDVLFTATPLFHAAARMMCVMAGLTGGLTVVVEPAFHAGDFLFRAAETGATVVFGVGAMGAALLRQPPAPSDRAHRIRQAIWVPFPVELQQAFAERFGVEVSAEIYGQTECVPITYTPLGSPRRSRESCGLPAPYLDVRLVDAEDRELPAGQVGEIVLRPRSPHVMFDGYWNKPDETTARVPNLWYHTGDYGRADSEGFITFVDRKKDAVRRRGENVSSLELENAIRKHPAVADVAVHAVDSDLTEDEIKACIVPRPDVSLDPAALFAFFEEALPYFAIPRYVEIVGSLPRNAVERVLKHVLRDRGVTRDTWDFEALGFRARRSQRAQGMKVSSS